MTSLALLKRRRRCRQKNVLQAKIKRIRYSYNESNFRLQPVQHIRTSTWTGIIYNISDFAIFSAFRVIMADIKPIFKAFAWLQRKRVTSRNQYGTSPELISFIPYHFMSSCFAMSMDRYCLFIQKAYAPVWDILRMNACQHLLCSNPHETFVAFRAHHFSDAICDNGSVPENCIGFLEGTGLGIAWTDISLEQVLSHNGHKQKYDIKLQTTMSLKRLALHAAGLLEVRKTWICTLCSQWSIQLLDVCFVDGAKN